MSDSSRWGRVAEDGTVYVRTDDGEREVGSFPGAEPAEALAYYERKFVDLAGQVSLLEQRARRGAPASDVARSVRTLRTTIDGAAAVGDLASLTRRLDALDTEVGDLSREQREAHRAEQTEAVAERTRIVEEAEALAARDAATVQWKQASAQLDELFGRWRSHQQDAPRLPKRDADELWKRFRTARSTVEQHRRDFFAGLDAEHRGVRERKERLIAEAEALAPRGAAAVPEYRELLTRWKAAGRAGRRADDQLWDRFKAAGDAVYRAKAEVDAATDEEYGANLVAKEALLAEAEPLVDSSDVDAARSALTSIQRRWEAVGRVPRASVRDVEDRMRRVETSVRRLDEERWRRTDPEKKARSEGLAGQLEDAIERLETELAEAREQGDARAVATAEEALAARRIWLDALR